MTGMLQVVRAGALTTVQDLGRPGHAHLGVPPSGALDEPAHRLANALTGNPAGAATLETTMNGCAVRVPATVTAAVTGAPCPVRVDGRPVAWGTAVRVPAGAVLEVGTATHGLRSYLALGGGVAVEPVLGSRSTDLLSGLGPKPLADGDALPLGTPSAAAPAVDWAPPRGPALPVREVVLPVLLGPREDWFSRKGLQTLAAGEFTVSSRSNRIGLRTEGDRVERDREGELPSEGMALGAIQVPPDGSPVLFLNDHPTTGGYPVVGVVPAVHLAAAAQAVPGTPVRFEVRGRRPAR
ncbi:biotin-dependent carboxyltransferase family protein [Streptomyces sp. NPDC059740]|uniref:5-oxoprolinase subunit C family protein n=1 Tax=Streptomyces sp. NPDC059740 TaxID=3346926 RepID=UPI00364F66C4